MNNVCLTTYVFGEKYQDYIPLLLYSLKKAYPRCFPLIFIDRELTPTIQEQVDILSRDNDFLIKTKELGSQITPFQGKAYRWILYDDLFLKFDYIYFVDIDIFYIKEPIPLHKQHIKHMELLGVPFSNIKRNVITNNLSLKTLLRRFKRYGFLNGLNSIKKGIVNEPRLTGLHFVKTTEYFEKTRPIQIKYEKILENKRLMLKHFQGFDDEPVLYKIVEEAGFDLSKLGEMSNSTTMLNFNAPNQKEFRPHHGLHLGTFRSNHAMQSSEKILNSKEYKFYAAKLKGLLNDEVLINIISRCRKQMKEELFNLFNYYNINFDESNFKK